MAWMLTLKVSSHSSSEISSIDLKLAWCAALLTRISMPPSFSHAVSMILRQCAADWSFEDTAVVHRCYATGLVRQHRLDGSPFVVGKFMARDSQLPSLGA